MDVIETEEQRARGIGELIVAQRRANADDVIGRPLETQRRRALEDDGARAFHAGGEVGRIGHAVISPLVKVTGDLQGALIDDDQARESTLSTQVVRQHWGRRRGNLEGVVTEVIETGESVVLQRSATGLHQDGQRREVAHRRVDERRVIGA